MSKPVAYPDIFKVDPSQWSFAEPRVNPNGGYNMYVNQSADVHEPIRFQGCLTGQPPHLDQHESVPIAVFGVGEPFVKKGEEAEKEKDRRQFYLSIPTDAQLERYEAMDKRCLEEAFKNAETWFPGKFLPVDREIEIWKKERELEDDGQAPTEKEIEAERKNILRTRRKILQQNYKPIVTPAVNKDGTPKCNKEGVPYRPSLNVKIGIDGYSKAELFLFDREMERIVIADIKDSAYTGYKKDAQGNFLLNEQGKKMPYNGLSGLKVIPIIESTGMWFTPGGFGLTLIIRKLIAFPRGGGGGSSIQKGMGGFALGDNAPASLYKPVVVGSHSGNEDEQSTQMEE